MTDLLAARAQMAMSLAFHIIFAAVGIAMPLLMVIAEGLWLKTREVVYRNPHSGWDRRIPLL
jgi:cytochrome d ubiquinol oxidase subunit I